MKLVQGVGIADIRWKDNKVVYQIWQSMLVRCYNQKYHENKPTYIVCTVTDDWKKLSGFKEWFMNSNYKPGLQLDKDITNRNNKVYGPNNCSFVSRRVNNLIIDSAASRGPCPIGVSLYTRYGKFEARLKVNGKKQPLGYFDSKEAASEAYKTAKLKNIKLVAEEELAAGNITKAVYEALLNWKIDCPNPL